MMNFKRPRLYIPLTLALIAVGTWASSIVSDSAFYKHLKASGNIHSMLPLNHENSLEARFASKKVLDEAKLQELAPGYEWHHRGTGDYRSNNTSATMQYCTAPTERAKGSPDDPDYANYGYSTLSCDFDNINISHYNRISFRVFADSPGRNAMNINFHFVNDDSVNPNAAYNEPTGDHLINLNNGDWTFCTLEIGDFNRSAVRSLVFSSTLNGKDLFTGDSCTIVIDDIRFQKVESPEKIIGWEPDEERISYSMTGYDAQAQKTAIVNASHVGENFKIFCGDTPVYEGVVKPNSTTIGNFGVVDFSELTIPGNYALNVGELTTHEFLIGSEDLWNQSLWKVLNFVYGMRCGSSVAGAHPACHSELFAIHNGVKLPYGGGWHDAGDLSQQTVQSGDMAHALLEAALSVLRCDTALATRLEEEARHGYEFLLRTRFGDGYRASSMGLVIWQDGRLDVFDDITSVRVQNLAYDNFLNAAYEAYGARKLRNDPNMAYALGKAAVEDFDFGMDTFLKNGYTGYITQYEHTYNTPACQWHATISWAASELYELTGEQQYASLAAEHMAYVLDCQETHPIGNNPAMRGFFYRDKTRKSIVHYIHQSRDHLYMVAADAICRTQPETKICDKCLEAMRLYAGYLKAIMDITAPYGMIPSGLYCDDEYKDTDNFLALHLFPPHNAEQLFKAQLKEGVRVDNHHYLKRFPIWFNIYNGNTAVHLATGKAAAICGNRLHDKELTDIAREQLYWTVGKNPFAQSLIYGEGYDYPEFNNFSSGAMTGTIPVGIRTIGNSDTPYWPQINNACYKEAWVASAAKWFGLVAELNK